MNEARPTDPQIAKPASAPPADMGPLGPKGVKALKIAVVVMGVMIIAGVALIIGRILYLASQPRPKPEPAAVTIPLTRPATDHLVKLPQGAVVEQTTLSGNRLLVRFRAGGKSELVVYDLSSGEIISRVRFTDAK